MALKFSFSLLFVLLAICVYSASALQDEEYKPCVPKKSYYDGCNTCICANNLPDSTGKMRPIIVCSQKLCWNDDGTIFTPEPAPSDFWQ